MALDSGKQTNQILTNDDKVCIPHLSSILLAVQTIHIKRKQNKAEKSKRIKKFDTKHKGMKVRQIIGRKC